MARARREDAAPYEMRSSGTDRVAAMMAVTEDRGLSFWFDPAEVATERGLREMHAWLRLQIMRGRRYATRMTSDVPTGL